MSDVTKGYKTKYKSLSLLSFVLTIGPLIAFTILAFINGEVHEKLVLGCTVVIALILLIVNVVMKYHIRSTLWILVLGIYTCLDNILPLLLTVAIATILDEFILHPLAKKYKNLFTINNEIDKRNPVKNTSNSNESK